MGVRTLAGIVAPQGERQTVYDAEHSGRSGLPGTREVLSTSSEPRERVSGREREMRRPDEMLYELTAQDGGRTHTLRYAESQLPEDVRQLIAWVDGRPERSEAIEPLGPAPT